MEIRRTRGKAMYWDGRLTIKDKYILTEETKLSDFMQSPLYNGQSTHMSFKLEGQYELWGHQFLVSVYFKDGVLCTIGLYCIDKQFDSGNSSWENMDAAKELEVQEKRKQFNDEFIKRYFQTDTNKEYPEVYSAVDKRNVNSASITIMYKRYWG